MLARPQKEWCEKEEEEEEEEEEEGEDGHLQFGGASINLGTAARGGGGGKGCLKYLLSSRNILVEKLLVLIGLAATQLGHLSRNAKIGLTT